MQPDQRFIRHRDLGIALGASEAEAVAQRDDVLKTGRVRMVASTASPEPLFVGGERWSEILVHDGADNVSTDACRSLLYNHDARMPVGTVDQVTVGGGQMVVDATIDEYARLVDVDVLVRRAVATGMVRGVSIGYLYDLADCDVDRVNRVLVVRRWRCTEVTLTPIPVDEAAHVRALELPEDTAAPAAHHRSGPMDSPNKPQDNPAAAPTPTPNLEAAVAEARERAVKAERERATKIAAHARALGLDAEVYLPLELDAAKDKMLADVAAQRAVKPVQTPVVEIVAEEDDKVAAHFADQLVGRRSVIDLAREFIARKDMKRAIKATRGDLADIVFGAFNGRLGGSRAVEVSSGFAQVAGLASQKVLQGGFDKYDAVWPLIAKRIIHGDFKAVRVGGLDLGDFAVVAEGAAATDIGLDEAGGTGTNEWRGRILEISLQAIYNDELNQFMDRLANLGYAGARSLDKVVQTAIQAATWTNSTEVLAFSEANLDTAWEKYAAMTSASGEKIAVRPRRLLVTSAQYVGAVKATTAAAGETTERVFAQRKAFSLMPVEGAHLTTAGAWYFLADPDEAAAAHVIQHPDYMLPALVAIDSGATASRKFRIDFPHTAFLTSMGTGKPTCARRFTAS